MCSHYQAIKERERYLRHFDVEPPSEPGKLDLWPGYLGSFIRRHHTRTCDDDASRIATGRASRFNGHCADGMTARGA